MKKRTNDLFYMGYALKAQKSALGITYYGYRYYDATVGRWINRDPIQERGGINLYCMVQNNSISKVDALGLEVVTAVAEIGAIIGTIAEAVIEVSSGVADFGGDPNVHDGKSDFIHHYYHGKGKDFDLFKKGYGPTLKRAVEPEAMKSLEEKFSELAKAECGTGFKIKKITRASREAVTIIRPDLTKVIFSVGDTTIVSNADGTLCIDCTKKKWFFTGKRFHSVDDAFTDPLNIDQITGGLWPGSGDLPRSKPYKIKGDWNDAFTTSGSF